MKGSAKYPALLLDVLFQCAEEKNDGAAEAKKLRAPETIYGLYARRIFYRTLY